MHAPSPSSKVTTAQVFAIAGPAMVANLTTPLIGIVSTTAIGRLGDATLLGGVAMASVIFDCLFWLFPFLRMSTVAFTAQSHDGNASGELRAILLRGFIIAALIGGVLIALQIPRARLFDRAKLMRMLGVNRDIKIRTAALITVWLFFTAQAARSGDLALAANAVLNNFLLVSAFFLDGLANAAEQLCGRAYGARDRLGFSSATRLVV